MLLLTAEILSVTLATMSESLPTPRTAARVLLIDKDQRVLLFGNNEWRPGITLWMTPGGGVDEGETLEAAAIRELWEETGLHDAKLGPRVWIRSFTFRFQENHFAQDEHFFIATCETFEPDGANRLDYEAPFLEQYRWWSVEEIAASKDYFVPRRLAQLLPALLAGDLPAEPIDCGV